MHPTGNTNVHVLVVCIRIFGLGCNIDGYIDLTRRITFETSVPPLAVAASWYQHHQRDQVFSIMEESGKTKNRKPQEFD